MPPQESYDDDRIEFLHSRGKGTSLGIQRVKLRGLVCGKPSAIEESAEPDEGRRIRIKLIGVWVGSKIIIKEGNTVPGGHKMMPELHFDPESLIEALMTVKQWNASGGEYKMRNVRFSLGNDVDDII